MQPEQVWDDNPLSGEPGFQRGEGTFSATPLAWTPFLPPGVTIRVQTRPVT